jgi:hypothetical protein
MSHSRVSDALNGFIDMTPWLWWLSITFFGIGDIITTSATTLAIPVNEGSPLVRWQLETGGIAGLVMLKIVAFTIAYIVWRKVESPHNVGVPLALAVLGIGLTTWNLFVLAYVTSS